MLSETETPVAPLQTRIRSAPNQRIPLAVKLEIRADYLLKELPSHAIAKRLKLTVKSVENVISREGWPELRRKKIEEARVNALARESQAIEEVISGVAIRTEQLSIGTLDKAADTLKKKGKFAARDLQAYSQAAKNFVGMARQARGLDALRQNGDGQVMVFVAQLERVGERVREPRKVEAIPVETAPGQTGAS